MQMKNFVNKDGKRIVPINKSFYKISNLKNIPSQNNDNINRKCTVDRLVFCTVNYNTQELTECMIKSINKFNPGSEIYVFDNSDKEPFVNNFSNVKVIDNTKGQIINFDEWLKKYPNKEESTARVNHWGSAKHCISIQKCIDIINKNFILVDSDILLKKDVKDFWDENMYTVGSVRTFRSVYGNKQRIAPFLNFINVELLKTKGIKYYDEQRMYGLYPKTWHERYDTGCSFYEDVCHLSFRDLEVTNYIEHYCSASWLKDAREKHHYQRIDPQQWLDENKSLWENFENSKKVIYTCITGGYDDLKEPKYVNPDFDYICFTDNISTTSKTWKIFPLPKETVNLDNTRKQRYVKLNPHKVLPNYDISIWVDANIDIKGNVNELLYPLTKNFILIPKHPLRNCIYEEAEECIAAEKRNDFKDFKEIIEKQINEYKKQGFPVNFGLPQSNIIIRKHNAPDCVKFMETWWEEVKNKSKRDQLSFNYVLWKLKKQNIYYMDKNIYNSRWFFTDMKHNKHKK